MSHDGSPSPMYWVFWTVFQAFQEGTALLQMDLEGFWAVWMSLDITGCYWMSLDITGGVWMSGRHVWVVPGHLVLGKCWLASPVGARVGEAHSGSRIDVVVVRE